MRGTCLGLIAVVGLGTSPALAQDMRSASEKVVACQQVADPAERLICFETAAAELSALLTVPVAQAPAASPAPVAPTAPLEAPSSSETELIQQAAAVPAPAPGAGDAPIQQAAVDAPATPEEPRSRLPAWIPRVSFAERRDVEREPDQFETTLTRIQRNNLGRHFFTTAEGHVWKQKGLDKIKAPSTLPTDVVLDKNIMGGITIKILETKENYPVTRVE
ncbi:MAG: hypothetical protein AAFP81_16445 [Pseudomonadota bacterium]